jgi:hypothetical protein
MSTGDIVPLPEADQTEKSFPLIAADGSMLWTQLDRCMGFSMLILRSSSGANEVLHENPGATGPSFSPDGREVLFTLLAHNVQYWLTSAPHTWNLTP